MARRNQKQQTPPVRQLEILDPPASSVVGKSFSVSGTCNAGNGVMVDVTCVDSQGHTSRGSCAIQDDNWSVPISVDCTGQLQSLAAAVEGGGSGSVSGVAVQESGILTLPNEATIGTEFTASGLCPLVVSDPDYSPEVFLTVRFNNANDERKNPTDMSINRLEGTWEAYFANIPHPNAGCDLTMICGAYNRHFRHIVSRLRTTQAVHNTASRPSHGDVFRAPTHPQARAIGNPGNARKRWIFITRGGRKVFRHVQVRPNSAGDYDHSLQDFYSTGGVELNQPYGMQMRTRVGNNMVHHSRGFHYFNVREEER